MKEKITSIFDSRKKKAAAIVFASAMLLTLGTATAMASDIIPDESFLVKNENGSVSYSEDEGVTWNEGKPENFHEEHNADGTSYFWTGDKKPEPGDDMFVTKSENETTYYSEDGGQTWSETETDGNGRIEINDDSASSKKD